MGPNNVAYSTGLIFGSVVVGILFGLVPLSLGRKRGRAGLGWTSFTLCVVSGLLLGLLGAVPMAGIMSLVIVVAGPATKKSKTAKPGMRPRNPAPQPYDL